MQQTKVTEAAVNEISEEKGARALAIMVTPKESGPIDFET